MSAADLPADMGEHARLGFLAFWRGEPLLVRQGSAFGHVWARGWWMAHARAFGHGVKSWGLDKAGAEGVNPYERFSPAGEAWAAGYDEAASL